MNSNKNGLKPMTHNFTNTKEKFMENQPKNKNKKHQWKKLNAWFSIIASMRQF